MENKALTAEPQAPSSPVDDFSLGLLLYILNKSIIWLILIIIISVSLSVIYLRYTPRIFQASTTLILKQQKTSQILGVKTVLDNQDITDINREIQLIKSTLFAEKVVNNLPLLVGYFKEGKTKFVQTELYTASPFEVKGNYKDEEILNLPIYVKFLGNGKTYVTFSLNGKDHEYTPDTSNIIEDKYLSIKINVKKQANKSDLSTDIYYFKFLSKEN